MSRVKVSARLSPEPLISQDKQGSCCQMTEHQAGRSEVEPAVAADKVGEPVLHCLEAHEVAFLAFKVVDDSRQCLEVDTAASVRAVVEGLLVYRYHG